MLLFAVGIVVVVLAIVLLGVSLSAWGRSRRPLLLWAALGALALGVVLALLSTLTVVGTRNYGVVTTFGRPTGRILGNGLSAKAPWQRVTDIDGTITTTKFTIKPTGSPDLANNERHCIDVRIADGSTACIAVVIRTRVDQAHAADIYMNYRNSDEDINDNVNDALVRTQLTSSVASVFADFDPLLIPGSPAATASTATTVQAAPDLEKYSDQVTSAMHRRLEAQSEDGKPEVDVSTVTLSYIYLSSKTQSRLNAYQAEVAHTRQAQQAEQTAKAQAAANEQLSASVSKDPNVLVSRCFDMLQDRTDAKLSIPAGFSCWAGGSSSVVVPSGR